MDGYTRFLIQFTCGVVITFCLITSAKVAQIEYHLRNVTYIAVDKN